MKKNSLFFFLNIIFSSLFFVHSVSALGISPAVIETTILPGTTETLTISIIRQEQTTDEYFKLNLNLPLTQNWITFENITDYIVPFYAGEEKKDITIQLHIPEDANIQTYKGLLNITTIPVPKKTGILDGVQSLTSVQAKIAIHVVDSIKKVHIHELNIAEAIDTQELFWWNIQGNIRLALYIENAGNDTNAIQKIYSRIYDDRHTILEKHVITPTEHIPEQTYHTLLVDIPTDLPIGTYTVYIDVLDSNKKLHNIQKEILITKAKPYTAGQTISFVINKLRYPIIILCVLLLFFVLRSHRQVNKKIQIY
ncbi:DUF4832 domain-containing protein [Patescibacteria group bacterium]|nr:DUF4832 domain-containing protein [Patescibacteria group bacterium]MBU1721766.1 DUF4832 domain-containing protein [Patescibacteria group bacterium]MBU1901395.1 DUF4832 domain-containing protein [Patescibacteria group bacterium]